MDNHSYALAYAYKKTKLWNKLKDTELIAVKTGQNDFLYLCVMGRVHNYCALAVYYDDESFQSYYRVMDSYEDMNMIRQNELMLSQDVLQCAFDDKEDLSQEELAELKTEVKKLGIRLSGKNAYAHFLKFEPFKMSCAVSDRDQEEMIDEALSATIDLNGLLEGKKPADLHILPYFENDSQVPVMEKGEDGHYVLHGMTSLPNRIQMTYPLGIQADEVDLKELKKIRKSGSIECGLVHMTTPVMDEDPPYFPVMLLCLDEEAGTIMPVQLEKKIDSVTLSDDFLQGLLDAEKYPQEVHVIDEQTEQLLRPLCLQAGIRLERREPSEDFEDAYFSMISEMNDDPDDEEEQLRQFHIMMEEMASFPDEYLAVMPDELIHNLEWAVESGVFDKKDEKRMKQIIARAKNAKKI